MRTLLGAQNFYHLGYADIADIVRRISDRPDRDLRMLFWQCVFNALIGNTDDHLKNFAMMHSTEGWHLTQAFDLLPDAGNNREHILHFWTAGTSPTKDALPMLGRAFGLSIKKTQAIIDEVDQAVRSFAKQCKDYAVSDNEAETLIKRMHPIN